MRRRLLLPMLLAVGCPKPAATGPSPPVDAPTLDPSSPAIVACPAEDPFVAFGWVPPAAEAVTLVELDAPGLADALTQLAEGAKDPQRQLPIRVAFALGQWTWQLPLLRTTLAQAGFAPTQLVHVSLPGGASAWAWPQSCDLPTITDNLSQGWGLSLRPTPYGAIALSPQTEDGALAFAYDFIAYGASAYLLVPAGSAHAVAQRLAERPTDPARLGLGEQAAGLLDAPLRIAIHNRALLTPGAEPNAAQSISVHRVDADGWSGS